MSQHLYILTGTSRGMGLALAQQLLQPGHTLICMARHTQPGLGASIPAGASLEQWSIDLSQPAPAAQRLHAWLSAQPAGRYASATLINNAGMIPPIAPLRDTPASELQQSLLVGLAAPMVLTSAFLDRTRGWPGQRRVLNISSGLGRNAMASQAAYCTAKAGMDQFTRCVALEEAQVPNGAKLCSLAPGVIDTDMQQQLRGADAAAFPDRERFQKLQSAGLLSSPADAAKAVLAWLDRPDFGTEPVADVRQG